MKYNRDAPSPEFQRYIDMYSTMHTEGHGRDSINQRKTGAGTFPGEELTKIKRYVKEAISRTGAKDMIDYGCGKAIYYEEVDPADGTTIPDYINLRRECIYLYEPAIPALSKYPAHSKFDLVICNDVIEHIPEPDVYWVIEELFTLAKECVVVRISCVEALAILPDGTNAHCTIKTHQYWQGVCMLLSNKYDVSFVLETTSHKGDGNFIVSTDFRYKERHC
jgi:hypothetical protein